MSLGQDCAQPETQEGSAKYATEDHRTYRQRVHNLFLGTVLRVVTHTLGSNNIFERPYSDKSVATPSSIKRSWKC